MHICQLNLPVEYYSPVCGGAIATVIMETSRELIARGHDLTILSITNKEPVYPVGRVISLEHRTRENLSFIARRWSDVRRRMGQWDWPYYEYYMRSYTRALKQLSPRPDVIIVHNDFAAPRFIKAVLPDVPVVIWSHNENQTRPRNAQANVSACDHYVTVSEYIRQWTLRNYGMPADRATAILNGVNLKTFHPAGEMRTTGGPIKVLFASRIDYNKGPDLAADAVAALRADGLPVHLTVAGGLWWYNHGREMEDPFFRELREKMHRANAEYLGHVTRDRIPALFREHDVVCLLSRTQDPAPLVCLEAMASGCVLLGSPRGGIPELVRDGGILVDPDDPAAVTEALRRVVSDEKYRAKMRTAGLVRAAQRPWARVAEEFERLCENRLLTKSPGYKTVGQEESNQRVGEKVRL